MTVREVWDTLRINITMDTCGTSLSLRISPGDSTQTARQEGTVPIQLEFDYDGNRFSANIRL